MPVATQLDRSTRAVRRIKLKIGRTSGGELGISAMIFSSDDAVIQPL
jgi:hypothetical protein